jgi:hypothetical protein
VFGNKAKDYKTVKAIREELVAAGKSGTFKTRGQGIAMLNALRAERGLPPLEE